MTITVFIIIIIYTTISFTTFFISKIKIENDEITLKKVMSIINTVFSLVKVIIIFIFIKNRKMLLGF